MSKPPAMPAENALLAAQLDEYAALLELAGAELLLVEGLSPGGGADQGHAAAGR